MVHLRGYINSPCLATIFQNVGLNAIDSAEIINELFISINPLLVTGAIVVCIYFCRPYSVSSLRAQILNIQHFILYSLIVASTTISSITIASSIVTTAARLSRTSILSIAAVSIRLVLILRRCSISTWCRTSSW